MEILFYGKSLEERQLRHSGQMSTRSHTYTCIIKADRDVRRKKTGGRMGGQMDKRRDRQTDTHAHEGRCQADGGLLREVRL